MRRWRPGRRHLVEGLTTTTLTVTSWNLQGSKGVEVETVAAHVRATRTDVLLLQEVQREQARTIALAVGAQSSRWALKHWPVRVRAEGMAVIGVTVPAEVRTYAVTRRWRFWNWRRRLVQIGRIGVTTVVNLHLTPHGPTSDADRTREVAWLVDRLGRAREAAAGGDYNAVPSDPLFARLRDAGLRDAWLAAHPDDPDGGYTNWSGRRNRPPMKRIDYLWVSADIQVVDVSVPVHGTPGFARFPALSDHLPVTATLRIDPTPAG